MNTATTLHILSSSPSHTCMSEFFERLAKTDSIVFTGDACHHLSLLDKIAKEQAPRLFILDSDAKQRGINLELLLEPLDEQINCIDMQSFVNLSLNHQAIIHW